MFGLGGENVGRAFVSLHANGDDVPDDIGDALDKMTPKFREAGEEHSKAYSEWFDRESKKNSRTSADTFLGGFRDELAKGIKDWDQTKDAAQRLEMGLQRLKVIAEDNDRVDHNWLQRFHSKLVLVNEELDRSATRTGKMFGKGSRNDLVNFIGAAIEGLSRLGAVAPKVAEKLVGVFTGQSSGEGMDLAKIATQVGTSIVGIAVGVGALITVLGAAATLVSGLAAALIGLVASATFAAGAIGAVALALVGPLAVGIGVVVAALVGMDDQTRKTIFKSVNPLIKRFKEAGDAAGEAFGPKLAAALDKAGPALDGLTPFFRRVGSALGDVVDGWAEMTQSSGFKQFTAAFSDFIPHVLRKLGAIAGDTLGGIGGIMRAAIPITQRFLGFLTDAADRFNEWANSKSGQGELADFFHRAAVSAKAIGGFIHDAIDATAQLLSAGKRSGDSLFREAGDQLQRFTEYLTDPKNQDAIKDFFANGIDVAEQIGNAIVDIGEAIGRLDTPESREFLAFLFDTFEKVLVVLTELAPIVSTVGEAIRTYFGTAATWILEGWSKIVDLFHRMGGVVSSAVDAVGDATHRVIGFFRRLPGQIEGIISRIPGLWHRVTDNLAYNAGLVVGRIIRWFAMLPGKILSFMAQLPGRAAGLFARMAERAISISANIVDWFGKLPVRIGNAIGNIWSEIKHLFTDIVDSAEGIVSDIAASFVGLAGKILDAIGTIDIGSLIKAPGGALGDFVSGAIDGIKGNASGGLGGVTSGPQLRWIGEDGPEAIVPLNRPLGMVDSSVRALSAIAQGIGHRGVDASGWTIVTQGPNPYVVAREVINDFAAKALF